MREDCEELVREQSSRLLPAAHAAAAARVCQGLTLAACLAHSDWDMPSEMTAMPRKMKLGGYATHMVGKVMPHGLEPWPFDRALNDQRSPPVVKWHAGIYKDACLPWKRGFDTCNAARTRTPVFRVRSERPVFASRMKQERWRDEDYHPSRVDAVIETFLKRHAVRANGTCGGMG